MKGPKTYKNFINGEWVKSQTIKSFENFGPTHTDEVVGVFYQSA